MDEKTPTERLAEALVKASAHWERPRKDKGERQFTIAISREAGARGSTVAREVGRRRGWPVYDHELLELIAREMKVRTTLLESVDEKHKSWLEEQVEAFSAIPHVSEGAFVLHLVETVLSLGTHGECVIVGRGAAHILPAATTLRVRLIAPLEDRVAVISRECNLPRQAALERVESIDRQRARFIRDHFHKDVNDPLSYDLVLNSSRLSAPGCAEVIVTALHQLAQRVEAREPAPSS